MSILDNEETLLDTMGEAIHENYLWDNSEMNRHTGRTSRLVNYYAKKFITMDNYEYLEIRDHHSAGNAELFCRLGKRLQFLKVTRMHYNVHWGELKCTGKAGYTMRKIREVYNTVNLLNTNELIGKIISDFYTIGKIKLSDYDFTNTLFPKDSIYTLFDLRQILVSEARVPPSLIYFNQNNLTLLYKR